MDGREKISVQSYVASSINGAGSKIYVPARLSWNKKASVPIG